jgi:excisionase family DNA binding protein
MEGRYYSSKEAEDKLGVCRKTLQNWANEGKIKFIRTRGRWRKYDIDSYLRENNLIKKKKICYCRVSSYDQKEDLDRQIEYLKNKYPEHEVIADIGSGINFKRKGLLKLIDMAKENVLGEIVITYKDRLCRIGYELLEYIFTTYSKTKIVIENDEFKPPEQGITEDLIEIITVYSSKLYGKRSYK